MSKATRQWAGSCLLVAGLAAAAVGLTAASASAQVLYGSVTGTVTDPQGYRVPGANIVITNTANGLKRETVTNNEGEYTIVNVQPGTYDVRISMGANFKAFERRGLDIRQGDIARVDTQLQAGTVTDVVNVTSTSELLQTDKADTSTKLDSVQVTNLPLNAYRNYQALVVLVPGTLPDLTTPNAESDTPQRTITFTTNGQTMAANQNLTDGAANVNLWLPNHNAYVAPAETIETVNIATSSMSAEQGNAAGAAVTVTTKSGTNSFKGSAFEQHTNSALNADSFSFAGTPTPPEDITRNTFGGTTGGPIQRNRLFFFGSYEGYYSHRESTAFFRVPDERARNGDFSHFFNTNGTLQRIGNPFTSGARNWTGSNNNNPRAQLNYTGAPACPSCATGLNVMDPALIDPVAKRVLALLPMPTLEGTGAGGFSQNWSRRQTQDTRRNNFDAKVNLNRTNAHQMWFKLSYMYADVPDLWYFPAPEVGGTVTRVYQPTFGQTWVLSPTLTFDSTLGVSILDQEAFGGDYPMGMVGLDTLGIPGTNHQNNPNVPRRELYAGIPSIETGFQTAGTAATWTPQNRNEKTISLTANLTKFAGRHEIRGGYNMFRGKLDHWQPERQNPRGSFVMATNATRMANITGQTSGNFYNQYAAFMFGLVRNMGKSIQNEIFSVYEWTHAVFVRDRWNVSDKLTFDLGLRYEVYPVMRRATRGMEMLDLDTLEIVIGGRGPDNPNTVMDESSETLGVHAEKDLVAPRFGAIYRLNDKTVARVGYGLAFSGEGFTRPFRGDASYPGALNWAFNTPSDGNQNWGWFSDIEDGIPFIDLPSNDLVRQPLPVDSANTRTMVPETVIRPRIHSYNVAFERQLPYSMSVDVAYVGNRSDGQWTDFNVNASSVIGPACSVNATDPSDITCPTLSLNGASGLDTFRPYVTKVNAATGQPFPAPLNRATFNAYTGFNKVRYNSLQISLRRPFRQGLQLTGAYTLARTRNFNRDYTPAEFQDRNWRTVGRTHVLSTSFVYLLPWQTGRGSGGVLKTIINDWQVNGIFQVYSGSRFSVGADGEELNTQNAPQRADLVGPVVKLGHIGDPPQPGADGVFGTTDDVAGCLVCDSPGPYFDPYAWAQPTGQRLGSSVTNQFTGPGATNLDFSIFRAVPLGGNRRLEIRFEANNFLNKPKWDVPNGSVNFSTFITNPDGSRTINNPDFMVVDDTTGSMRQARVALRFSY
jgi:hypothetical protein